MSSAPLISSPARRRRAASGCRAGWRPDRARHDPRRLVLRHQGLDERIVLDHALGLGLAAIALGGIASRGRVDDNAGLDLEPLGAAFALLQRRLKPLAQRRRAQVLALDTQLPDATAGAVDDADAFGL